MSAFPIVVSTDAPVGGPALRVRAFASDEISAKAGPAIPVYIVSSAELANGTFVASGNIEPVQMVAVTGQTITGQRPIPVVVVEGSFLD